MSWDPCATEYNAAANEGATIPAMEAVHRKPVYSIKARCSNENKSTGAHQETTPAGHNGNTRRTGVGRKVQVPQNEKDRLHVWDHKHGAEGGDIKHVTDHLRGKYSISSQSYEYKAYV